MQSRGRTGAPVTVGRGPLRARGPYRVRCSVPFLRLRGFADVGVVGGGPEPFLQTRAAGAGLFALPPLDRLAAEMALHEAQEQHALAGRCAGLVAAWHDAAEIAAIADDLLLPEADTRAACGTPDAWSVATGTRPAEPERDRLA